MLSTEQTQQYHKHGFLVLPGFFSTAEADALRAETDRLLSECAPLIDERNLRCRFMRHHQTNEQLFEVFDPVNDLSPLCEQVTCNESLLAVLAELLGEPVSLFKEKLIFKLPGAKGYDLHQDIPLSWPGFPKTFTTVLMPIDESTTQNGCTEVFSGYHDAHLCDDPAVYMLPDETVDDARRTMLALRPGDIAIFHGLTPHRSGPNTTSSMRRAFYVSYNATSDGGDQRSQHYDAFRERMRQYLTSLAPEPVYFR